MACPEQRVPLPEVGEVRIIGLLSHNPLDSWDFADFHWRLARARPNHDRMLSLSLAAAGVPHYAPVVERVVGFEVLGGKVVVSTRKGPMFPGYVFVGGEMGRGQGAHKHVLRFEAIPGQDRVVADLERLEAMRLAEHPIYEAPLEPGHQVLIQGGPYKGFEGRVIQCGSQARLVVEIRTIGRLVAVEIPADEAMSLAG